MIYESNYLIHHGIKGQKWGEQNGPPYPLNPEKDYSTLEKKENSLSIKTISNPKNWVDLYKDILPARNGVEDFSIVAYLVKQSVRSQYAKKYIKERYYEETDPKTGFKLKSREMTKKEDIYRVNPDIGTTNENGSTRNCVLCSLTYEMRRRGYDVRAGKTAHGFSGDQEGAKLFGVKLAKKVPGQEVKGSISDQQRLRLRNGINKSAYSDVVKELSKTKNSRGQVLVTWANGYSGHSFIYEVDENGKVTFLDGQIAKIYKDKEAEKVFRQTLNTEYQRLDNGTKLNVKFAKEIFR